MILLDSEGINAVAADDHNDNQIFTLTFLLASVLIYNSKNVPRRTDLKDLKYPFDGNSSKKIDRFLNELLLCHIVIANFTNQIPSPPTSSLVSNWVT